VNSTGEHEIAKAQKPQLAVGAVIIDQRVDGPQVVLIRRGQSPMQGHWSLPGGRVEWGERLEDAVRREVREETRLEVQVGRLVEVVEILDEDFHYVVLDYYCERVTGLLSANGDVSEAQWVPVFDLAEYELTPAVRRVIARAIADDE
jgi:8-oxo-dGTP diphosphatase